MDIIKQLVLFKMSQTAWRQKYLKNDIRMQISSINIKTCDTFMRLHEGTMKKKNSKEST